MRAIVATVLTILTRREKAKALTLTAADLLITLLDIAFLALLLLMVNFYTTGGGRLLMLPFKVESNSLQLILIFFLLYCFKNWLGYWIIKAQQGFFYGVASRLSAQNMWRYLKQDHVDFTNTDSSAHVREISHQPIEFSTYILANVQQVMAQGMLISFTIIAIICYHPLLFAWLFVLLLPPVVALAWFIKRKLKRIRTEAKTTNIRVIQYLQEALRSFVESNIYNKNAFFADRYINYQQQLNSNISTQQTLQALSSRAIEVFAILGFMILIAVNKWSGSGAGVDLLSLGVFMAASYKIIPGVVKILNSLSQIKTYAFVLPRLQPEEQKDAVDMEVGVLEKFENKRWAVRFPPLGGCREGFSRSVKPLPAISQPTAPFPEEGVLMVTNVSNTLNIEISQDISSVKFEAVSFKYDAHPVLDKLDLEILPGDFVGISGRSGLGKTTVINLLLGFLQQDSGTITINDQPTTAKERQLYWPRISYVKQQSFFINDSILKNIVLTDGDYDAGKLSSVIVACGLDAMVAHPEGNNKLITENGKNISGGQRQRIAFARALYHDFDLLLLDEPFSEMDEAAEKDMLQNLNNLAEEGKMIILITHNKAGMTHCNKIIKLGDA